ncbi:MAG: lysophospholipase [Acholeplasmataceae bacterium]|jgi:alpha-beta hydrolase superfamily lysophospholipase
MLTFDKEVLYFKEDVVSNGLANVLIIHGIAEHSGRYDHVVKALNKAKFNVFRFDLRGHGKSAGKRGYVKNLDTLLNDVYTLVEHIKDKYPGKIFLLGHSLGGGIANTYASQYFNIDGYISSGAATDMVPQMKPFKVIPYQLLKWVTIKNNLSNNMLASIKEVEENYQNDPLVLKKYKIGYLGEVMIKGSKILKKNYDNIKVPALIMHGLKDPIVPVEFSQNLYQKIASTDKELVVYEKSLHEIYNDIESEDVIKTTVDWLINHA